MGVCHPSHGKETAQGQGTSTQWLRRVRKPAGQDAQPLRSFKGRPPRHVGLGDASTRLPHGGVLAAAGAAGNERSGRRALGKTPRTPFAFKDSMIH